MPYIYSAPDSICSVEFGTNPTATTSTACMVAGQTEYQGVPAGQNYMVAAITVPEPLKRKCLFLFLLSV